MSRESGKEEKNKRKRSKRKSRNKRNKGEMDRDRKKEKNWRKDGEKEREKEEEEEDKQEKEEMEEKKENESKDGDADEEKREGKDASTAALISVAGTIFIIGPGIGYLYLDDVRRAIAYTVAYWILNGIVSGIYFFISTLTLGFGLICFPIYLLNLAFALVIIYDVYKFGKGEETVLPEV